MKLSSKKRDYYDKMFRGLMTSHDASDKDVFVRETRELSPQETREMVLVRPVLPFCPVLPCNFTTTYKGSRYHFDYGVIAFCGAFYPFISVDMQETLCSEFPDKHFYYDYASLAHAYPAMAEGKMMQVYGGESLRHIQSWFDQSGQQSPALIEFSRKQKCAYFSICDEIAKGLVITAYPMLNAFEFIRRMDVPQTCQQLVMFLTNVLVKPDDPYVAPVPDEIKAESHGYDQFSFRKEPSSNKRKVKK